MEMPGSVPVSEVMRTSGKRMAVPMCQEIHIRVSNRLTCAVALVTLL